MICVLLLLEVNYFIKHDSRFVMQQCFCSDLQLIRSSFNEVIALIKYYRVLRTPRKLITDEYSIRTKIDR